jgi:hypothetical protein
LNVSMVGLSRTVCEVAARSDSRAWWRPPVPEERGWLGRWPKKWGGAGLYPMKVEREVLSDEPARSLLEAVAEEAWGKMVGFFRIYR